MNSIDSAGRACIDSRGPGLRLLGLRGGPLALASKSPRRRELLERLEVPLVVLPTSVPEGNRSPDESPESYVTRLAEQKARAAMENAGFHGAYACLGADTVVEVDGAVLEQPVDRDHAAHFLETIGGRWHRVHSGLALIRTSDRRIALTSEVSSVYFEKLTRDDLELYLDTREPMDKAGGYGIQGWGGIFVSRIEGDFFNVMGLPLAALRRICLRLEGE